MSDERSLSKGDRLFGVVAAFSALYCLAVSFVLSLPDARKRFLISAAIFVVSFCFVRAKKGVAVGILAFVVLRFAWAGFAFLLKR